MYSKFQKRHGILLSILLSLFLLISCTVPTNVIVSGKIVNSINGEGIEGFEILIAGVVMDTTDTEGAFEFSCIEGVHLLEFNKEGFSIPSYSLQTVSGFPNVLASRLTIANPTLERDTLRIVMTWGEAPEDLDSTLILPNNTILNYENMDSEYAILDLDDTDSFGPETITIKKYLTGNNYSYKVDNYSEEGTFKESGVNVRIYFEDNTFQDFTPSSNAAGNLWHVFDIQGKTILPINTFSTVEDD